MKKELNEKEIEEMTEEELNELEKQMDKERDERNKLFLEYFGDQLIFLDGFRVAADTLKRIEDEIKKPILQAIYNKNVISFRDWLEDTNSEYYDKII